MDTDISALIYTVRVDPVPRLLMCLWYIRRHFNLVCRRDARDARYNGSTRAARKRRGEGRGADEAVDGCMTRSAASRLRVVCVTCDIRIQRVYRV